MIKKFNTSVQYGDQFKVSINFRTNTIRVYEKSFYNEAWYKSFLSSPLTKKEIHDIAYVMTADEFRKFIIEDKRIHIWRY